MIHDVSPADLPRIRELLRRSNDTRYDLEKVAEEKCFGAGFEGASHARVFGDFEGIAGTCGRHLRILAVDRARRGRGIGTALLRDAEARGTTIIGAEPGNYFTPGAPENIADFFLARGYEEKSRTQNLICHCEQSKDGEESDSQARPESALLQREESASQARGGSLAVFAARDDKEKRPVLDFIEKNFGRIWRFEASKGEKIFFAEENGEIAGFVTQEANNRGLGFFGPTGIAKSHRGRGFGRLLLLASLAELRRLGYDRAVIPWTDAIEFYRKSCGARVADRFVILRRRNA